MSTEYRRGIPSTAHVEAATRLGLLWHRRGRDAEHRRFVVENGQVLSDYGEEGDQLGPVTNNERHYAYYCIRPDGTPVDWEVLDQEVARVQAPAAAQPEPRRFADVRPDRHGWRWWRVLITATDLGARFEISEGLCRWHRARSWFTVEGHSLLRNVVIPTDEQGNPVSWESIAQPTPTTAPTQPQGFRADLWRRICEIFNGLNQPSAAGRTDWGLSYIASFSPDLVVIHGVRYQQLRQRASAEILARWTVYQELKPLYDLVDGAQGEAAMPRDVIRAWWDRAPPTDTGNDHCPWTLQREHLGLVAQGTYRIHAGNAWSAPLSNALANFAAVLDAVAERRVAERMRGQTQATTVTSAQPEPRRFANVRPDRHGWRWWRVQGPGIANTAQIECSNHLGEVERQFRFRGSGFEPWTTFILDRWLDRTVIPTDEQGNPVSWESIGPTDPTEMRYRQALAAEGLTPGMPNVPAGTAQTVTVQASPGRVYDVEWVPTNTTIGTLRDVHTARIRQLDRFITANLRGRATATQGPPTQLTDETTPLPRFTADELDDVDHSKTTKLDEVTLRRGKLPTVEQIGKYREVLAKRSGTVTEALKASGIDCEVAQYVLERWAGGLSDKEALWTIIAAEGVGTLASSIDRVTIDERVQQARKTTLDIAEPTDNSAQRQREEREAQRLRMAALQAQLAAERAARTVEPQSEPNRFDLLECDPKADPAVSIAAWEARQKRSTVRLMPKPQPQPQPQPLPAPCRLFEVVDAEAEGLRPGAVFTALLGRALNPNC